MKEKQDSPEASKKIVAKHIKKTVTINLDIEVIEYFKELSDVYGIPYQTLINLYLSDCVTNRKGMHISWDKAGKE